MKTIFPILSCLLLIGSQVIYGFESTFERTLSGNDWFRTFSHHFPLAMKVTAGQIARNKNPLASLCKWRSSEGNLGVMGGLDPGTGEYLPRQPNTSFLNWLANCIEYVAKEDLDLSVKEGGWENRFFKSSKPNVDSTFLYSRWDNLAFEQRQEIILFQLHRLIGPSPIKNQARWISTVDESLLSKTIGVKEAYIRIVVWIAARPEYLTY